MREKKRIERIPKGIYSSIKTTLFNFSDLNIIKKGVKGTAIKLKGTGAETIEENHKSSLPNFYWYFAIECKYVSILHFLKYEYVSDIMAIRRLSISTFEMMVNNIR